MTSPRRYSVPVDELDAVEVPVAEQVQEERRVAQAGTTRRDGSIIPAYGDGGSNDADSD